MEKTQNKLALAGIFVLALFALIGVSRYLTFNPDVYFPQQREVYVAHPVGLAMHVIGGMVATAIGPFQFVAGLRKKRLNLHRNLGKLYLLGCLSGGIGGVYMSTFAYGGFPATAGFAMLGSAWLFCAAMAFLRVRQYEIDAHREWMIRSFSLTLAAATLRIYLMIHGILYGTGAISLPFEQAYVAIAWLCWVPNLIFAEWYINRSRARTAARTAPSAPLPAK